MGMRGNADLFYEIFLWKSGVAWQRGAHRNLKYTKRNTTLNF